MKRYIYTVLAAFAAAAAALSFQVAANPVNDRDWKREMALTANDLTSFLKYHPTDGASHEGKVRKAMDPSNIQP